MVIRVYLNLCFAFKENSQKITLIEASLLVGRGFLSLGVQKQHGNTALLTCTICGRAMPATAPLPVLLRGFAGTCSLGATVCGMKGTLVTGVPNLGRGGRGQSDPGAQPWHSASCGLQCPLASGGCRPENPTLEKQLRHVPLQTCLVDHWTSV